VTGFGHKSLRIVVDTVKAPFKVSFYNSKFGYSTEKNLKWSKFNPEVGLGPLLFNVCERRTQLGYIKWEFYLI
jgi:predicted carbohydrate-binding protein with CBM5 and CBM33 domain